MTFKTAKYIAGGILFAAMALTIVGMLTLEKGSSAYTAALIGIIAMIGAALGIAAVWCRCPKCGKRILSKLFKLEKCPQCGYSFSKDGKYKK